MIKFTNISLNCANCTSRCRPISTNATVVRKSSWGPNYQRLKTSTKQWSGSCPNIQGRLTAPWGGSRAPGVKGQLLGARNPHQFSCRFASVATSPSNLYDILGVSPKATHKEIKAAYYNLSMTYHPDKNSNSDVAALKFREITAAYEVLGNFLNRKKYDRGIMPSDVGGGTVEKDDRPSGYETSRGKHYRSQVSVHMGRSTIYDFDEWTKMHYGATMAKKKTQRENYERHMARQRDFEGEKHVEIMMAVIGFMIMLVAYTATRVSYDRPYPIVRNSNDTQSQPLVENDVPV